MYLDLIRIFNDSSLRYDYVVTVCHLQATPSDEIARYYCRKA